MVSSARTKQLDTRGCIQNNIKEACNEDFRKYLPSRPTLQLGSNQSFIQLS